MFVGFFSRLVARRATLLFATHRKAGAYGGGRMERREGGGIGSGEKGG